MLFRGEKKFVQMESCFRCTKGGEKNNNKNMIPLCNTTKPYFCCYFFFTSFCATDTISLCLFSRDSSEIRQMFPLAYFSPKSYYFLIFLQATMLPLASMATLPLACFRNLKLLGPSFAPRNKTPTQPRFTPSQQRSLVQDERDF